MKRILSLIICTVMIFSLVGCANGSVNTPVKPPASEDNAVTDVPEMTDAPETTTSEPTTQATTEAVTTTEATATEATTTAPEVTATATTTTEVTTTLNVVSVSKEMYINREASVREAPDENAKRITKLQKGDKVSVSEIVEDTWYLVTCGDVTGYVKSGYLSDEYVSATEATTTAATTTETVTSAEPEISKDDKVVALTFDDGPNTSTTVAILDILEEYGVVATFFVIGNNINANTGKVMQRAVELGCEIGNHSKTHQRMSQFSASDIKSEIEYVQQQVEKYTGTTPKFFRAPFIDVSQTMHQNIDLTFIVGYGCTDWEASVTAQQRIDTILDVAHDGAIFLMHDFTGNNNTVEAIKTIIPELLEQGYKFVTVSQLFEIKGVSPKSNSGVSYTSVK